jgi:hypothetical protein
MFHVKLPDELTHSIFSYFTYLLGFDVSKSFIANAGAECTLAISVGSCHSLFCGELTYSYLVTSF